MDLYHDTAYRTAKLVTEQYSTSFSASCRLLDSSVRPHIYAIYGLVRLADEIVDSYKGEDMLQQLDGLEAQLAEDTTRGFSSNLVLDAFIQTASSYDLPNDLVQSFFASMRQDATDTYTPDEYASYIYGSAEVVGLMSLRVFVQGDERHYQQLASGARALGRSYQKINFLRDFQEDYSRLDRVYFPDVTFESFNDAALEAIAQDISHDMAEAKTYITQLPTSSRSAVWLSFRYYQRLFDILRRAGAATIRTERLRVPNTEKAMLFAHASIRKWSGR